MKRDTKHIHAAAFFIAIALSPLSGGVQNPIYRHNALADSAISENRPTPETAKLLREELLLFQRATQTYLWARQDLAAQRHRIGGMERSPARAWKPARGLSYRERRGWRHRSADAPRGAQIYKVHMPTGIPEDID